MKSHDSAPAGLKETSAFTLDPYPGDEKDHFRFFLAGTGRTPLLNSVGSEVGCTSLAGTVDDWFLETGAQDDGWFIMGAGGRYLST